MENKPASLLVVSLGMALNEMPPSLCGRQVVESSSLPIVVAQSRRLYIKQELIRKKKKKKRSQKSLCHNNNYESGSTKSSNWPTTK